MELGSGLAALLTTPMSAATAAQETAHERRGSHSLTSCSPNCACRPSRPPGRNSTRRCRRLARGPLARWLADQEIADRARRRFELQLAEAQLPPGKTLANVLQCAHGLQGACQRPGRRRPLARPGRRDPGRPARGRQKSLGGGDRPGAPRKRRRVLYARTIDLVQKLQVARRELALEAAIRKLHKYHLLILDDIAYVRKDQAETSVLFEELPLRGPLPARHRQPAVRRVGLDLPRTGHDAGGHRPARASGDHLRTQCRKLSPALRRADPTPPLRASRAIARHTNVKRQRLIEERAGT